MSLQTILLEKINNTTTWLNKGELYQVGEEEGFSPEYVGRELRTLAKEGKIQVSYYKSKKNIELARYARIGTETPVRPKEIEEIYDTFGNLIGVRRIMPLINNLT